MEYPTSAPLPDFLSPIRADQSSEIKSSHQGAWERQLKNNMAANETEEIDVAKEFNLLPVIFETIQALQKTNDPQEFTKKVFL